MIVRYHTTYRMDICLDKQKEHTFKEAIIYEESLYREYTKRIVFKRMMNELEEDDVIVVESLEMLGNTTKDLLHSLNLILDHKIHLQVEDIQISTKDEILFQDFIFHILQARIDKEKQLEQEKEDIQVFHKEFQTRKKMDMNYRKLEEDLYRYLDGKTTINNLAIKYGVSESYLYNHVKKLEHK